MQNKVLVTGFEPFGGEPVNPAGEVLKLLDGKRLEGCQIVTQEIPTVRFLSLESLRSAVTREDPIVVISLGQAGGRSEITPERVAINVDDFRIPDNGGNQPVDEPVIEGAPAAYWSTLPIKSMVRAMRDAGVPASVSNSAGTFVCNHLFYGLMHLLAAEGNARRGGFVHIPYMTEQARRLGEGNGLPVATMALGIEAAIRAALTVREDLRETGGRLH